MENRKPVITLSTSKLDYQEWFSDRSADAMYCLLLLKKLIHNPKSFSFASRKERQQYHDELIYRAIHNMYLLYLKCQWQDIFDCEDHSITKENIRRIYEEGTDAWEEIKKELYG